MLDASRAFPHNRGVLDFLFGWLIGNRLRGAATTPDSVKQSRFDARATRKRQRHDERWGAPGQPTVSPLGGRIILALIGLVVVAVVVVAVAK